VGNESSVQDLKTLFTAATKDAWTKRCSSCKRAWTRESCWNSYYEPHNSDWGKWQKTCGDLVRPLSSSFAASPSV